MAQNYNYPSSSDVTITGTPNGAPIPNTSILVAAENPSGNQEPLQVDSSGNLLVALSSDVVEANVNLTEVGGAAISLGQKTSSASLPVVIASDDTVAISATSLPLPTGAATSALQTTGNTSLATIVTNTGKIPSLGQAVMASSTPVAIASDQSSIPVTVASLPLPSGAATAANQATEIGYLSTISLAFAQNLHASPTNTLQIGALDSSSNLTALNLGQTTMAKSLAVALASDQSTLPVSAASLPLPSGAATSALQTTGNTSLATIVSTIAVSGAATPADAIQIGVKNGTNLVPITEGQATMANSLPVVLASDQSAISTSSTTKGTAIGNAPVQNVYSTTNITTSAYVQLVASTSSAINTIHIFDSSGQAMILGLGGSGSEVATLYVPPGGDTYTLNIPAGTRISYKALSATATSGYLLMSFLG